MRLGGPELKMPDLSGLRSKLPGLSRSGKGPELKAPDFLLDIYYDLRERRLLPLVALVVVAIAATPFLLGQKSEVTPPPAGAGVAEALGGTAGKSSELTVVESTPGLRDYRKRLHGTPTDPFVQQYTGVPNTSKLKSTGEGEAGGSSTGGSGESSTSSELAGGGGSTGAPVQVGTSPGGSDGSSGGSHTQSGKSKPPLNGRYFAYRPDVRFGVAGSGNLTTYNDLALGKLLPKKNPVVIFIGVSEDGKRVAFDVSHEVTRVKGSGKCIGGEENCGLLFLRSGQAVNISSGTPGRVFRLAIGKIEFVEVDRPKPASSSSAGSSWAAGLAQNFSK